jgi:hypothetical protein
MKGLYIYTLPADMGDNIFPNINNNLGAPGAVWCMECILMLGWSKHAALIQFIHHTN